MFIIPHLQGPVSAARDQQAFDGSAPNDIEQPVLPEHFVFVSYRTLFAVKRHQKQSTAAFEPVILRRGYG